MLESDEAYQALRRVVEADFWTSQPVFVPVVMSGYAPPPAVSHLVVSEVLYNPGGADEIGREWIEIYNPSNAPVSLRDHKIGDSDAPGRSYGEGMYAFPQAATLPAFGALVVAQRADLYWQEWGRRPDYELSDYDPAVPELISYTPWSTGTLNLGNAGDQVILLGADDRAIDSAVWGSATFTGTAPYTPTLSANHSLQRWPPDGDTDNCASDFRDQPMPSPGEVP